MPSTTLTATAKLDRFMRKVDIIPGGCWEWRGAKRVRGYGAVRTGPRKLEFHALAHRVAYELLVAEIPDGLVLDHLCRNTSCVNPKHLEPVQQRENVVRGVSPPARNAAMTHCRKGHEFSAKNTVKRSDGGRTCRICQTEYQRHRWITRRRARISEVR